MKLRFIAFLTLLIWIAFSTSCDKNGAMPDPTISTISITLNGSNLVNGADGIPTNATLAIVFSAALVPADFEAALSITSAGGAESFSVNYTNATSKATIELMLDYATTYTLRIGTQAIGANGGKLEQPVQLAFTTQEDDVIRSMAPCTGVGACLRSVQMNGTNGSGAFEFYSNYPIHLENAEWENLTQALIVVHGSSHNPDDYFSYLTNTLSAQSLSETTVLIAPFFRPQTTGSAQDFYWSGLGWRDGQQSGNSNKISSFEVVDELIQQLADKQHFPVLDQIIVTGQSSGGRFTHVYAPSNKSEALYPDIRFDYIVSESQYFYYPDGQRINEGTNQLYTPTGCTGYDIWPFGFNIVPSYLGTTTAVVFNQQFVNRSITYLLGNGSGSDGSLNTTDCSATLLGSTRYLRGENIFRYMELVHPGTHQHRKTVANGISHDGSAIYQSPEFRSLLMDLLN